MAIGEYGNNKPSNEGKGKLYEQAYYPRIGTKAENGLQLKYTFRSGLLSVSIQEWKDAKFETLAEIFLSPMKAYLFAEELDKFKGYYLAGDKEALAPGKAYGVNAGMGEKVSYIGIHMDENERMLMTIGKIDGSGNILESCTIELNKDYHYALEWDNINTMDLAKAFNNFAEFDMLRNMVYDFGRNMNGAIAYSVADLTRYDQARILGKMDPIYDKLGIERRNNGNQNSGNSYNRSNNFLNNSRSVESEHRSYDSIEEMMSDE